MRSLYLLCAVCVAFSACQAQARLPVGVMPALSDEVGWFRVSDYADVKGLLTNKRDNRVFSVAIKFIVPPENLHDFVDKWAKLEDSTSDESGNVMYEMRKTLNDNFMFVLCGEWKSYKDWEDHVDSKASQKFRDWLAENEIMYFIRPLTKVTDDFKKSPSSSDNKKSDRVGLLFRFHVHQKDHADFIDAWYNVAEKASREHGNEMYTLRKSLLDNTEFYGHGTWQRWDDLWDHLESDHFSNLKQFAADKDVFWTMAPIRNAFDRWD